VQVSVQGGEIRNQVFGILRTHNRWLGALFTGKSDLSGGKTWFLVPRHRPSQENSADLGA